jgi:biopolymer transport protein ExbB/TolQ
MTWLPLADIEDVVFHVANVLRIPVIVATIAALAFVLFQTGALVVELVRRRHRSSKTVEAAARDARSAMAEGDRGRAAARLASVACSSAMWETIKRLLDHVAAGAEASNWMSKCLADFDLDSVRRLERTRLLVRAGPALGLMGTLIPLAPALTGLAKGNVKELTDNLRVAFSVTVLGLLIGVIAFSISLVRDRLYAQDLSDLEIIAAELQSATVETATA